MEKYDEMDRIEEMRLDGLLDEDRDVPTLNDTLTKEEKEEVRELTKSSRGQY